MMPLVYLINKLNIVQVKNEQFHVNKVPTTIFLKPRATGKLFKTNTCAFQY